MIAIVLSSARQLSRSHQRSLAAVSPSDLRSREPTPALQIEPRTAAALSMITAHRRITHRRDTGEPATFIHEPQDHNDLHRPIAWSGSDLWRCVRLRLQHHTASLCYAGVELGMFVPSLRSWRRRRCRAGSEVAVEMKSCGVTTFIGTYMAHVQRHRTSGSYSYCIVSLLTQGLARPMQPRGRTSIVLPSTAHRGAVLEDEDAGS